MIIKISELPCLAGKCVACGVRPINKTLHEYDIPCLQNFFPMVILLCLYEEPQPPKKTQNAPRHRPQTPSIKNFNPENPIQVTNPETPAPKPP